uniref:LEM-like domain-containing protein n=1 Tax=Neolamprologus brichardi TaxID=32507 RepID=A0A3Q4HB96_NEOBR
MPFVEEPAHLSKSRLKSDLVAHNVALPPAASKKAVYVELHLKHIDQKNAADFSSDEEDRAGDVNLDLKSKLVSCCVSMPASTRVLYERKLHKLLQSDRCERLNKADKVILYSDSEEEEKQQEKDEDLGMTRNCSDSIIRMCIPLFFSVTRRRPIKGAAQRPVQYSYPDSPVSPMTQQRREVERYLVPIHIQILVFIIVACVLYLIYVGVEDSLSYWSYGKDRLLVQAESQDADVDYAQD